MRQTPKLRDLNSATLHRLGFRLLIVGIFATLWPGHSVALTVAALCLVLAVLCAVAAVTFGEPILGPALNRWDEALVLCCVALLAYLLS